VSGRYLVVGDVHGCVEELRELLDLAGGGREIVLVGDLVAKGPGSHDVLVLARERSARAVLGNHDQHLIRWRDALDAGEAERRLSEDQLEAARELDADDWAWLRALPFYIRLEDAGAVVVHGGFVSGVPLERQKPEHMLTLRSILPDGTPSKKALEGVPWASLWPGPELVLFGHDAIRGLQMHRHAIGLDTGCVYGGQLTGYLLPERRLVQVDAKKEYSKKEGT